MAGENDLTKSLVVKCLVASCMVMFIVISTLAATGTFSADVRQERRERRANPQPTLPPNIGIKPTDPIFDFQRRHPKKEVEAKIKVTDLTVSLKGDRSLHVRTGGNPESDTAFVLIHGANRKTQNATYWEPYYELFGELGQFWAFDNLGHGTSIPGKKDNIKDITRVHELNAIHAVELLIPADPVRKLRRNIVLVARSYGGGLALNLISDLPHLAAKAILIAPGNPDPFPEDPIPHPALVFWSKNDPIMPFSNSEKIMDILQQGKLVTMESETHFPEMEHPDIFESNVREFLKTFKDVRAPAFQARGDLSRNGLGRGALPPGVRVPVPVPDDNDGSSSDSRDSNSDTD